MLLLPCLRLEVRVAVVSCLRCWQCRDYFERSLLGRSSKIGGAGARQSFRILGLGEEEIGDSSLPKDQIPWPTRIADGAES